MLRQTIGRLGRRAASKKSRAPGRDGSSAAAISGRVDRGAAKDHRLPEQMAKSDASRTDRPPRLQLSQAQYDLLHHALTRLRTRGLDGEKQILRVVVLPVADGGTVTRDVVLELSATHHSDSRAQPVLALLQTDLSDSDAHVHEALQQAVLDSGMVEAGELNEVPVTCISVPRSVSATAVAEVLRSHFDAASEVPAEDATNRTASLDDPGASEVPARVVDDASAVKDHAETELLAAVPDSGLASAKEDAPAPRPLSVQTNSVRTEDVLRSELQHTLMAELHLMREDVVAAVQRVFEESHTSNLSILQSVVDSSLMNGSIQLGLAAEKHVEEVVTTTHQALDATLTAAKEAADSTATSTTATVTALLDAHLPPLGERVVSRVTQQQRDTTREIMTAIADARLATKSAIQEAIESQPKAIDDESQLAQRLEHCVESAADGVVSRVQGALSSVAGSAASQTSAAIAKVVSTAFEAESGRMTADVAKHVVRALEESLDNTLRTVVAQFAAPKPETPATHQNLLEVASLISDQLDCKLEEGSARVAERVEALVAAHNERNVAAAEAAVNGQSDALRDELGRLVERAVTETQTTTLSFLQSTLDGSQLATSESVAAATAAVTALNDTVSTLVIEQGSTKEALSELSRRALSSSATSQGVAATVDTAVTSLRQALDTNAAQYAEALRSTADSLRHDTASTASDALRQTQQEIADALQRAQHEIVDRVGEHCEALMSSSSAAAVAAAAASAASDASKGAAALEDTVRSHVERLEKHVSECVERTVQEVRSLPRPERPLSEGQVEQAVADALNAWRTTLVEEFGVYLSHALPLPPPPPPTAAEIAAAQRVTLREELHASEARIAASTADALAASSAADATNRDAMQGELLTGLSKALDDRLQPLHSVAEAVSAHTSVAAESSQRVQALEEQLSSVALRLSEHTAAVDKVLQERATAPAAPPVTVSTPDETAASLTRLRDGVTAHITSAIGALERDALPQLLEQAHSDLRLRLADDHASEREALLESVRICVQRIVGTAAQNLTTAVERSTSGLQQDQRDLRQSVEGSTTAQQEFNSRVVEPLLTTVHAEIEALRRRLSDDLSSVASALNAKSEQQASQVPLQGLIATIEPLLVASEDRLQRALSDAVAASRERMLPLPPPPSNPLLDEVALAQNVAAAVCASLPTNEQMQKLSASAAEELRGALFTKIVESSESHKRELTQHIDQRLQSLAGDQREHMRTVAEGAAAAAVRLSTSEREADSQRRWDKVTEEHLVPLQQSLHRVVTHSEMLEALDKAVAALRSEKNIERAAEQLSSAVAPLQDLLDRTHADVRRLAASQQDQATKQDLHSAVSTAEQRVLAAVSASQAQVSQAVGAAESSLRAVVVDAVQRSAGAVVEPAMLRWKQAMVDPLSTMEAKILQSLDTVQGEAARQARAAHEGRVAQTKAFEVTLERGVEQLRQQITDTVSARATAEQQSAAETRQREKLERNAHAQAIGELRRTVLERLDEAAQEASARGRDRDRVVKEGHRTILDKVSSEVQSAASATSSKVDGLSKSLQDLQHSIDALRGKAVSEDSVRHIVQGNRLSASEVVSALRESDDAQRRAAIAARATQHPFWESAAKLVSTVAATAVGICLGAYLVFAGALMVTVPKPPPSSDATVGDAAVRASPQLPTPPLGSSGGSGSPTAAFVSRRLVDSVLNE